MMSQGVVAVGSAEVSSTDTSNAQSDDDPLDSAPTVRATLIGCRGVSSRDSPYRHRHSQHVPFKKHWTKHWSRLVGVENAYAPTLVMRRWTAPLKNSAATVGGGEIFSSCVLTNVKTSGTNSCMAKIMK